MPLTCSKCGADNRESAKFCLKCAHQLVPLSSTPARPAKQRKRRRQRLPSMLYMESADNIPRPPWRLIGIAAALLTGAALWAFLVPHRHTAAVQVSSASVTASPQAPAPAMSTPASQPLAVAAAPAAPHTQSPAPPPALADAPPLAAPAPSAVPPKAVRAPATTRTKPRAPAPAATQPAPAAPQALPPPAPPPPAPAPAAPPSPAPGLCAGSQFIAHAICLQAECNKPDQRQHPQCVRMRERQEALRAPNN